MYVERTKTAPLKSEDYNEQSKSLHCHTHLRAINYDNHFPAGECVCVCGGGSEKGNGKGAANSLFNCSHIGRMRHWENFRQWTVAK